MSVGFSRWTEFRTFNEDKFSNNNVDQKGSNCCSLFSVLEIMGKIPRVNNTKKAL